MFGIFFLNRILLRRAVLGRPEREQIQQGWWQGPLRAASHNCRRNLSCQCQWGGNATWWRKNHIFCPNYKNAWSVSNLYGKFGFFISTPFSPNFAQSEMPTWNHYYCHCIDEPHVSARQFIEIVNNGRKDDTNLIHISCSSRKFELPNFV